MNVTQIVNLPIQQSALADQLSPLDEKSSLQLFLPQDNVPLQSASLSQSPSPFAHGVLLLQHDQSVEGTPLQVFGAAGVVVAAYKIKYE